MMWWLGLGVAAAQPSDAELAALEAAAVSAETARDDETQVDRPDAAIRAVELRQALLDAAVARGEVTLRTEPPEASGTPPRVTPIPLPPPLARLVTARGRLLALLPHTAEGMALRREHDLANALAAMSFGHFEWARERLWRIYVESCRSDGDTTEAAFRALAIIASVSRDDEAISRLGSEDFDRRCSRSEAAVARDPCDAARWVGDPSRVTFALVQAGERARGLPRDDPRRPGALEDAARAIDLHARDQLRLARECRISSPADLLALAGDLLRDAHQPSHAALAFESALQVGEREESTASDRIVALARYGAAMARDEGGEPAAAIAHLERLLSEERFIRSTVPEMRELVADAAVELARLHARHDDPARAAEAWARAATLLTDPIEARDARFHQAETLTAAGDVRAARAAYLALLREHRADPASLELRVIAASRLAPTAVRPAEARRDASVLAALVDELPPPTDGAPMSEAQRIAALVELERADALLEETRPRHRAAAVADAAVLLARAAARSADGANGPACVRLARLHTELPGELIPARCSPPIAPGAVLPMTAGRAAPPLAD